MKSTRTSTLLAWLVAGTISTGTAHNGTAPIQAPRRAVAQVYTIKADASVLNWEGKSLPASHNGTIRPTGGQLQLQGRQLVGGTVTVDMTTINVLNIADPAIKAKFTGHITSDDFFGVAKYPTASFTIAKVTPLKDGANNVTISGNLTIKGKTNAISFPARVTVKGEGATVVGTATIDRTKFDVRYGSKSFFADLGDKAIYDDFTIAFNLVAESSAVTVR